jgi:hypothetical protein
MIVSPSVFGSLSSARPNAPRRLQSAGVFWSQVLSEPLSLVVSTRKNSLSACACPAPPMRIASAIAPVLIVLRLMTPPWLVCNPCRAV